ncbi:shikimate dehydrogenase [Pseudoxanthobacter sp. M-2]|uniref:shikimate dehydrogenase n=1 Tax=Pseudoxanthobacter sp. M-2 TaxID=3078754 RepID=UPI0038FD34B4
MSVELGTLRERLAGLADGRPGRRTGRDGGLVVGLVGRGIQASRTPSMHESEGARLGLHYAYGLIDFDALGLPDEALGEVLAAVQDLGFRGLNVTHPFKRRVLAHVSQPSPETVVIGAANTVVFRDGQSLGFNTDGWGFARSFEETMQGAPLRQVVQFGAGGAGAAVAHALIELGVEDLVIVDLDRAAAAALAGRFAAIAPGRVRVGSGDVRGADGIVNTTPIGMAKYPGTPLDTAALTPAQWVADIVYFPAETELLRNARAIGCRVLPGTGMAIYQAVRAFELFTGLAPDPVAMTGHFEAAA